MTQHGPRDTGTVLDTRPVLTEAGATVLAVAQLWDTWGDTPTEELDPTAMWEQLGRALGRTP